MRSHVLPALVLACTAASAIAADLDGVVRNAAGDPVGGAAVSVIDLRLDTTTDPDGSFSFSGVAPGEHLLSVRDPRFGGAVLRVLVAGAGPTSVEVELDQKVHAGDVSVTASGRARSLDELTAPVDVLAGDDLVLRRAATLGDTLSEQPGVAATGHGQGSSRPVIRGLGGDRIRILENGLGAGDVSSIGPDHAVSVDPLAAEQIEIVRGPATLLYGGTAVGGVVNVLDGRVPDRIPAQPVTGSVDLEAGSNADQRSGAVRLDGGTGRFAWHLSGFARDADDYDSPAPRPAEDEHDHGDDHDHPYTATLDDDHDDDHDHGDGEMVTGRVDDSFVESRGLTVGASWVGDRGYLGVAAGGLDSEYGVPGHGHHGDEDDHDHPFAATLDDDHDEEEEGSVFVDLEQRRLDLHGRLDRPFAGVDALTLRAGWRDYEHREMEGEEVGTRFTNELVETRVDALLAPIGRFEGTAGVHWIDRDFAAAGEEAFVQPTTTRRLAAYLYEQAPAEPWGFELGLRYERQDTETVDPDLPSRDFDAFSAAAGVSLSPSDPWLVSLTATRAERAPTAEELYSDGPHAATFAYEIGDPDLATEVGTSLDLTLRARSERLEGTVSVFRTWFDGFVYLAETGAVLDGLDVFRFAQADADLYGLEIHGDAEVYHSGERHVHVGVVYDQVRAKLSDRDENLPRIPPRSAKVQLTYLDARWSARLEARWVDEQDEVAPLEEPTPDHTLLGASVGYRFFVARTVHELLLKGTNLSDEAAYNHVSFLKEVAPVPGRNVSLSYRVTF